MTYLYCIGIAVGLFIPCHGMETGIAIDQTEKQEEENQQEQPVFTVHPMRVLLPAFAKKGYIQWEKDPERPHFQRINISFLLQNLCKDKELTKDQADFLERFKSMQLPCPIKKKDMDIIEQLSFEPLFALAIDKNAKIKHTLHYNPALGFKILPKDSN